MLEALKEEIWQANQELAASGLVVGTSGNVSGRDPETGLFVIKPSGVSFADLRPEQMSVVDASGQQVEGPLKPSVDTLSHAYVYRTRDDIQGVVHTHSRYATVFAVLGDDIPVLTTTHAALFGAPIPVSNYAVIGEEEIGKEIVENVGAGTAVLIRSHGVFTIGSDWRKALRSAQYVEECAEVAHLARQVREPEPLADETVAASRDWYLHGYGQKAILSGS
ncbi:L-ribulose 5-phosphate 4-epimerase [Agrococcus baldri]|uniref:L-ribulose-5-phosphate 4-epimerase n=1 Tax=Agrococcus baldri TaxID=153730 RepID=A0AA94HMN7_9MICO|nr:L-ribulose-5-phosphate 4-epimerase [Agrococcus baldri]SFS11281.1 L-ribulose 5-phosphate 4-epimerase [Agrococcus baldri]